METSAEPHRPAPSRRLPARLALVALLLLGGLVLFACDDGGSGNGDSDAMGDTSPDGDDDTVGPSGNEPPELDKIGNRRAPIGVPLRIALEASDPEGDELTYSVFGALPEGAKFAKDTHTFEWTPAAEDDGKLIILTFAVSDGNAEDRETIQITVTTSAESTRPVLQPIGDVFVDIEKPYELRLQATDEDGDELTFSTNNPLPDGATLDPETGVMQWTPSASQQGASFRVNFVVDDGEFTDDEDARFLVQKAELALKKMAPREVAIGETLTVTLPVQNPLDFKFTCEVVGELTDGAAFDTETCTLTYSPTDPALVGASREFVFRVTGSGNGVDYNLIGALTVNILAGEPPPECQPDSFEPNDTEDVATPLTAGSHPGLSVCGDVDWYTFEVPQGATIRADVLFEQRADGTGDLEALLFAPTGEEPIAAGDSVTSNETVTFAGADAGIYSLAIYEYRNGQNDYDLELTITTESTCSDDTHEPNNSQATATPLPAGPVADVDGMLCAGSPDWFSFDATAGDPIDITLVFDNSEGDLDLELYNAAGMLVAESRLTTDEESIVIASAPSTGRYAIKILGYQGAQAAYLLQVERGGCGADAFEPNDDAGSAAALPSSGTQTVSQLTACGDDDYFVVPLGANEPVEITMSWTQSGASASLDLLDPNGIISLASGVADGATARTLTFDGDTTARNYILEVRNATPGLRYSLAITAGGGGGCDAMSCELNDVCDDAGMCVEDLCANDSECPSVYRCRQTFCVDACATDADCRQSLGYACRVLALTDIVPFCAPTGSKTTGQSCFDMTDCGATQTCLRDSRFPNGMCAAIGCADDVDCDVDSACVEIDGTPVCMPFCFEDGDCRSGEGYTCKALTSVGSPGTTEVCIK